MASTEQLTFDLPVKTAFGRNDFFVSPSNNEAVVAIEAWQDWPERKLMLTGPKASGKSHLVQVWAEMASAQIICLQELNANSVKELTQHPLAIENIDAAMGNSAAQNILFHIFNLTKERGVALLLTAHMPVAQMGLELPDLISRLQSLHHVQVNTPDDALLSALMVKYFEDKQIDVAPAVIAYLLLRMERSFLAVQKLVNALDQAALVQKRAITRQLAEQVLDKLTRSGPNSAH